MSLCRSLVCSILSASLFTSPVFAKTNLAAAAPPAVAAAPTGKEKTVQKREYEGSIRGIRALMSDLKNEKPNVYTELKADAEDLDARQSRANYVYWGSFGVATGLVVYGFARAASPQTCDSYGSCESKFSFYPFVGALAVYYGGALTSAFIAPNRQEYLNFTNKHNRLNPDSQLEWSSSFGLVPVPGGGKVQYALSFP